MSCYICTYNYSYGRLPLTLDCGHCMCRVCYGTCWERFNQRVACPECQRPTTKPADSLELNHHALNEGRRQQVSDFICVTVLDIEGNKMKYNVKGSTTVLALKEKIQDSIGMPIFKQSLVYRARAMDDFACFGFLDVEDGSIINLIPRYSGC